MNPKLIIYGVALTIVCTIGGCIYLKGRSDSTQKADLQTARKVIVREREVRQVESITNTRVDAESIDTTRKAKAADNEIKQIRERVSANRSRAETASDVRELGTSSVRPDVTVCDPDAARVMQLAREARAAAVESAAKLQSARTSTR